MCFKLEAKTKRESTVKCVWGRGGGLLTPSFYVTKDIIAVFYVTVKILFFYIDDRHKHNVACLH
jgi:hypothetical protein